MILEDPGRPSARQGCVARGACVSSGLDPLAGSPPGNCRVAVKIERFRGDHAAEVSLSAWRGGSGASSWRRVVGVSSAVRRSTPERRSVPARRSSTVRRSTATGASSVRRCSSRRSVPERRVSPCRGTSVTNVSLLVRFGRDADRFRDAAGTAAASLSATAPVSRFRQGICRNSLRPRNRCQHAYLGVSMKGLMQASAGPSVSPHGTQPTVFVRAASTGR